MKARNFTTEKEDNVKELDLHGSNYEQVILKCHKFINDNWGRDLKIITGNSNYMKRIVSEIINKYRLQYVVGGITGIEGYIIIRRKT